MRDEPDLRLAGLSLWVRSPQFEESDDYWDGNWLYVLVRVEAPGAYVEAAGPFVRTDEIERFTDELTILHRGLRGAAELQCLEPNLTVKVTCGARGGVMVVIDVTPDHMAQQHRFEFEIDQSYLGETLAGCRRLLAQFPIKGSPPTA